MLLGLGSTPMTPTRTRRKRTMVVWVTGYKGKKGFAEFMYTAIDVHRTRQGAYQQREPHERIIRAELTWEEPG
jgi:hypothetical protein